MSGEKAAVEIALDAAAAVTEEEPETAQVDLLGFGDTNALVELRAKRNAKGRPPGARNKRTVAMANYLLSRYTSPLEVLAQIATARVDELVAVMACTKLEAVQEKRLAAIALLPYLHQKQPVAIDVTNNKVVHLTIVEGDSAGFAGAGDDEDTITLTARLVEAQEAGEEGEDGE